MVPPQLMVAKSRESPNVVPQKRTRARHEAAPPATSPLPAAGTGSSRRTRDGHHGKPASLAQTSWPRSNGAGGPQSAISFSAPSDFPAVASESSADMAGGFAAEAGAHKRWPRGRTAYFGTVWDGSFSLPPTPKGYT
eukprot:scaffold8345_cov121-Isochrysis_galbana.AAC.4